LTVEQTTPLPAEMPAGEKRGNLTLRVEQPVATRVVYHLN